MPVNQVLFDSKFLDRDNTQGIIDVAKCMTLATALNDIGIMAISGRAKSLVCGKNENSLHYKR